MGAYSRIPNHAVSFQFQTPHDTSWEALYKYKCTHRFSRIIEILNPTNPDNHKQRGATKPQGHYCEVVFDVVPLLRGTTWVRYRIYPGFSKPHVTYKYQTKRYRSSLHRAVRYVYILFKCGTVPDDDIKGDTNFGSVLRNEMARLTAYRERRWWAQRQSGTRTSLILERNARGSEGTLRGKMEQ